ncbi:hypothetical protein GF366_00730 [Candidatus Peregrinibacteria bacterium]|nr:hypothetical protein [Candidatus Peregrinibacteria bacterium]
MFNELLPIVVLIILVFILLLFVYVKYKQRKVFSDRDLKYLKMHWNRVISEFDNNPKESILDADILLDFALSKKGFEGNLGEKLKSAGPRFSDINGIWRAHKLRNRVAHELSDIDESEAKRAIKCFKNALKDLGAKL